jgi:hypothetical protein
VHTDCPVLGSYVPGPQSRQADARWSGMYVPFWHRLHTVWPVKAEKRPG